MDKDKVLLKIEENGIIPVIVIKEKEKAQRLGKTLWDNGMYCVEITFRTEAASESIRIMKDAFPEMILGAGTVLTTEQVDRAIEAGASFIVSPGLNPEIVKYCQQKNILIIPGIATPGELEMAWNLGLRVVKFFPAELSGGLAMIQAMAAAYTDMRFMPTGGISPQNVTSYLNDNHILACGGSWMVKENLIEAGEFDVIGKLSGEAVEMVKNGRTGS